MSAERDELSRDFSEEVVSGESFDPVLLVASGQAQCLLRNWLFTDKNGRTLEFLKYVYDSREERNRAWDEVMVLPKLKKIGSTVWETARKLHHGLAQVKFDKWLRPMAGLYLAFLAPEKYPTNSPDRCWGHDIDFLKRHYNGILADKLFDEQHQRADFEDQIRMMQEKISIALR